MSASVQRLLQNAKPGDCWHCSIKGLYLLPLYSNGHDYSHSITGGSQSANCHLISTSMTSPLTRRRATPHLTHSRMSTRLVNPDHPSRHYLLSTLTIYIHPMSRVADCGTSLGIPDSNGVITGSGDDVVPIGGVGNGPHPVSVPLERTADCSTSLGIPDSNGVIEGSGGDVARPSGE